MAIECDEWKCCETNRESVTQGWFRGNVSPSTFDIEYTCRSDVLVYLGLSTITPLYPAIDISIPPM